MQSLLSLKVSRTASSLLAILAPTTMIFACNGAELDDDEAAMSDDTEAELEVGTLEQALCENSGGTNSVMTALAVATGRELRRWQPEVDFKWNSTTGRLELSATGTARCGGTTTTACVDTWITTNSTCAQQKSWGNCNASWMGAQCAATCGQCSGGSSTSTTSGCKNIQALLDMQKPEANGKVKFPGNITLDTALLRSKLRAAWNDQMSCNATSTCKNVPAHELRFDHVEDGSCDKKFFFDPFKAGTTSFIAASSAATLANKLKFLGYPSNKMLNFYIRDGKVSVDPTYGLNEDAAASAGSCDAACTKVSGKDVSGKCCSCNGATRKFAKSAWNAQTYLCQ